VLGHTDVADYTDEVHRDPRIADLAARVYCEGDPDLLPENFPARVAVETRDGRRFEHAVAAQRGGPGNPMSDDDHRAKFRSNARPVLGEERTEELLTALERIWGATSTSEISRLIAA
jgi:2-methylcitrate dehydratase PrpD